MKITVIISYYKAIENLVIILNALNLQSNKNFELIISEDDFNEETVSFLNTHSSSYDFKIHHIFQEKDDGFRKNIMLNKAILKSNTDYLVFIDGDCIPHRHFIKEYSKSLTKGFLFIGRAVLLDEKLSLLVKQKKSIDKLNLLSIFLSRSKSKKNGIYLPYTNLSLKTRGLIGRNWGIYKQHLIDINGFDNDYIYAGVGEDVDIEWRLLKNGIKQKSIKNKAIVYHLFHEKVYSELNVTKNYKLLEAKKQANNIQCLNGLKQVQ